jgi:hypothetical protein
LTSVVKVVRRGNIKVRVTSVWEVDFREFHARDNDADFLAPHWGVGRVLRGRDGVETKRLWGGAGDRLLAGDGLKAAILRVGWTRLATRVERKNKPKHQATDKPTTRNNQELLKAS